jgi:hypothetical protein
MARIDLPMGLEDEVERIWLLQPEIGKAYFAFRSAAYNYLELSEREKEVARIRIAQINECKV